MRIKILGCSGGIGLGLRTTSILIDDDVLIDMGTGVGDLTLTELESIESVFLTHSHLDHTVCLPLVLDTTFDYRVSHPLAVYALDETIEALRKHMFNDVLWPDFEQLPSKEQSVVEFHKISAGDIVTVHQKSIRAVKVLHSVPALGYCFEYEGRVFAFSGDTSSNKELWPVLNAYDSLEAVVVEVSFPNSQQELACASGHYTPKSLAEDLKQLNHRPGIWVTAMKPGMQEQIFAEVREALPDRKIYRLRRGDVFDV